MAAQQETHVSREDLPIWQEGEERKKMETFDLRLLLEDVHIQINSSVFKLGTTH